MCSIYCKNFYWYIRSDKDCAAYQSIYQYIQGDSRLVDITAGGDFLGICDQKS